MLIYKPNQNICHLLLKKKMARFSSGLHRANTFLSHASYRALAKNVTSLQKENTDLRMKLVERMNQAACLVQQNKEQQLRIEQLEEQLKHATERASNQKEELLVKEQLLVACDVERQVMIVPLREQCRDLRFQLSSMEDSARKNDKRFLEMDSRICSLNSRVSDLLKETRKLKTLNGLLHYMGSLRRKLHGRELHRMKDAHKKAFSDVLEGIESNLKTFADPITLDVDPSAERYVLPCGHAFDRSSLPVDHVRNPGDGSVTEIVYYCPDECYVCRKPYDDLPDAYPCVELKNAVRDLLDLQKKVKGMAMTV